MSTQWPDRYGPDFLFKMFFSHSDKSSNSLDQCAVVFFIVLEGLASYVDCSGSVEDTEGGGVNKLDFLKVLL